MDYGWMLLRMMGVLAAVCALAFVVLRWGLKRMAPFDADGAGRLEVVERLGLGPKQSLLVVRAGEQYLLVGISEGGFEPLGTLDAGDWQESNEPLDDLAQEL